MDDLWKELEGKKVFVETNSGRQYSGKVVKVNISENPKLIWITMIDKFGNRVTFIHSEIKLIEEEK